MPVVTEKFEIDYGDESKSKAQGEHLDYQNSKARLRLKDYQIEHF